MRFKIVLPWRYLVMLGIGLAVLYVLLWRYGRSDTLLIGWVICWFAISRGVDWLIRRRQKPLRFDREE